MVSSKEPVSCKSNSIGANSMSHIIANDRIPSLVAPGGIPPVLPPSVEEAYKNKCVNLKRRMNEVEESNDEYRRRKIRLLRGIRKMRLERAFLLETLGKRMNKTGTHGLTEQYDENSDGSSVGPPTPLEKPLRSKRGHRRPVPSPPQHPLPAHPNASYHIPLAPHPPPTNGHPPTTTLPPPPLRPLFPEEEFMNEYLRNEVLPNRDQHPVPDSELPGYLRDVWLHIPDNERQMRIERYHAQHRGWEKEMEVWERERNRLGVGTEEGERGYMKMEVDEGEGEGEKGGFTAVNG